MSHNLPPGVVQGPDGKFMSVEDGKHDRYQALETITFDAHVGFGSGDLTANASEASFEGEEIVDFNEIVGRGEVVELIGGQFHLDVYASSASGSESLVNAGVEVSSSPGRKVVAGRGDSDEATLDDQENHAGDVTLSGHVSETDDPDLITRPLRATAYSNFEDTTNATAGAGSTESDTAWGPPGSPADWDFDRRDAIYYNGIIRVDNGTSSDIGAHAQLGGQMTYGVLRDELC